MSPAHPYYLLRMRFLLWRAGVTGGEGARCFTRIPPLITNDGRITIGRGLRTDCYFAPAKLHSAKGGHLEIGDYVYINSGAQLSALMHVRIGDEVRIAEDAYLCDSDFHRATPETPIKTAPIDVGRNVWIGRRATIMPGITIGEHSVVGTGAVVTKNVPPKCIVGGIPARVLRTFECADDWVRR